MNRRESPEINTHTYDIEFKHKNNIIYNNIKHMKYLGTKLTQMSLVIKEKAGRASAKALRQKHYQPQGGNWSQVDRGREVGKGV